MSWMTIPRSREEDDHPPSGAGRPCGPEPARGEHTSGSRRPPGVRLGHILRHLPHRGHGWRTGGGPRVRPGARLDDRRRCTGMTERDALAEFFIEAGQFDPAVIIFVRDLLRNHHGDVDAAMAAIGVTLAQDRYAFSRLAREMERSP